MNGIIPANHLPGDCATQTLTHDVRTVMPSEQAQPKAVRPRTRCAQWARSS